MNLQRDGNSEPTHSSGEWFIYCGILLIASGCLHLAIWQFSGEDWSGQVSWRKPTLFGISGGLTIFSLGLLLPKLRPCRRDNYLAPVASFAMLIEVGLITVQQWRGVPSHFNHSTTTNWLIDLSVTGLITLIAVVIFDYCLRALRFVGGSPAEKLAWRGGMIFLALSCILGFAVFAYGQWQVSNDLPPEIYRGNGVLKFPHGIVIHAIQVLPVCVWMMKRAGLNSKAQVSICLSLIASFSFQLVFSLQQTLGGRSRLDLTFASGSVLALSLLLLLALPLAIALKAYARFTAKYLR